MDDRIFNNQEADDMEIYDTEQALDIVQDTLESFLDTASVDVVYGEPIENGDHCDPHRRSAGRAGLWAGQRLRSARARRQGQRWRRRWRRRRILPGQ